MQTLPPIPPSPDAPAAALRRQRRNWLLSTVGLVVLAVVCIAMPETMAGLLREVSPGCVFRRLTGIACPGCGGTRAAQAILHGDMMAACRYNLLLPVSLLLLLVEYVRRGLVLFTRTCDWREKPWYRRTLTLYAWLVIAWFILRNILGI